MDFIYELYKNDNFTTYLLIALAVLVVLFIVVLVFGKKDQKLEETKRLQKINIDTFKEEKKEPEKVEVVKHEEVVVEKEPEIELPIVQEEVHVTDFEPYSDQKELTALLEETESTIKFDEEALEKDLQEIESLKKEFSDIELPKVEDSVEVKEEKPVSKSNQEVFSSVYTKPEEPKVNPVRQSYIDDDGEEIELPALK